ncbi:MAG: hypothetical protein KAT65_05145 [Methanophagales archaeon]|nr:hypothetical protein [Methanophagales archaeon]
MSDFTNMDEKQIEKVIVAFNRGIDNFLKNLKEIKKIHGVTTTTDEVMKDLLALSKKQRTLDEIRSLHRKESRIIKKKSEISFEIGELEQPRLIGDITSYFGIGRELESTFFMPGKLIEETEKFFPLQYFALGKISAFEGEEIVKKKSLRIFRRYQDEPYKEELELKHQVGLYKPDPIYSLPHVKEGGGLYD